MELSPCLNSGTSDTGLYPGLPEYDIDQDSRLLNPPHDIGFDEFLPTPTPQCLNHGDVNNNGSLSVLRTPFPIHLRFQLPPSPSLRRDKIGGIWQGIQICL